MGVMWTAGMWAALVAWSFALKFLRRLSHLRVGCAQLACQTGQRLTLIQNRIGPLDMEPGGGGVWLVPECDWASERYSEANERLDEINCR